MITTEKRFKDAFCSSPNMKNPLKDILRVAILCMSLLTAYTVIDIIDLPSRMGIPIQCINWDAASLLCGNMVVIALFVITYRALDKQNIQKEHNQRRIAVYMLRTTTMLCASVIEWMKEPHTIESIQQKIDSNKPTEEDPFFQKILSTPFADHESIVSFASAGVLSEEEFSEYNVIRMYYRLTLISLITFPDDEETKKNTIQKFVSAMDIVNKRLDKR